MAYHLENRERERALSFTHKPSLPLSLSLILYTSPLSLSENNILMNSPFSAIRCRRCDSIVNIIINIFKKDAKVKTKLE